MAQQLYFSRDTRMFVQFRNTTDNTEAAANLGKGSVWEIPILDGYSFSQTTNTSEITLSEMESSAGVSRRGGRMFTDSLAPAEWSFSTYIRPFTSLGATETASTNNRVDQTARVHAVEEVLWASMLGADTYTLSTAPGSDNTKKYSFVRNVNPVPSTDTDAKVNTVATAGASTLDSAFNITQSNRSALQSMVIYFLIDTATSNPLVYRLPESVVNEASIDFDVDGIAMINWSGFSKEIQDVSGKVNLGASAPANSSATTNDASAIAIGDIFIDTSDSRSFNLVNAVATPCTVTRAFNEATTSTLNFIRNRLTAVDIEAAEATDKVAGTFPGSSAVVASYTSSTITSTAHGFSDGDQVHFTGSTGATFLNDKHLFVGAATANTYKLYDTKVKGIAGSSDQETLTATSYNANSATAFNGKYALTLTGGSFTIGNNITYLVPEELGAINKPIEHVTGSRSSGGSATCYLTLEDGDITSGTSRQFFNDLVGTGAMAKVVNKFKVTMHIGGSAATGNSTDPALKVEFPTAHITVPTHSIEDVISLEVEYTALPTDFGTADEITAITYFPVDVY